MKSFTRQELQDTVSSIKVNKAARPDKISPDAVKILAGVALAVLSGVFNKLLKIQDFPKVWKEALVVLIWQGEEKMKAPSFRLICSMNT
ncbi:hypothetical protein JTB14_014243 [Gonioctena quinquepunctata]|nr:hypothetical protein JTB14_014243 [Gonioctena quinquepunctata]